MFDKLISLIIELGEYIKPIIFVLEYKQGVLMRAGKFQKILLPGWHFKIPFLDDFIVENVKLDTMKIKEVNVTTLDGKQITIAGEFELEITDIYKALIETNDWRSNLHDICQGILSDTLEDIHWDDIRKKSTKTAIGKKLATRANDMGITTSNFSFTDKTISKAIKLFNNTSL